MKTAFCILNEDFSDQLKITLNGESKFVSDEAVFEYPDGTQPQVLIEHLDFHAYLQQRIKNPVLRFLAKFFTAILGFPFALILFFCDNESGMKLDKGFSSLNPYTLQKHFTLTPTEKVELRFIPPKFDRRKRRYTPSDLVVETGDVTEEKIDVRYSPALMKREWLGYHVPGYVFFFLLIGLLNALGVAFVVKAVREIPQYTLSENIGAFFFTGLAELGMLALFVVFVVFFVRSYKRYKEIDQAHRE